MSNPLGWTHCILSLYPLSSSRCSSILSRTSLGLCWMTAMLRQSPRTLTEVLSSILKGADHSQQCNQSIQYLTLCTVFYLMYFHTFVSSLLTIKSRESICSDPHSLEILWSLLLICWMLLLIHCRWKHHLFFLNDAHYCEYYTTIQCYHCSSKYWLSHYLLKPYCACCSMFFLRSINKKQLYFHVTKAIFICVFIVWYLSSPL